MEGQQPVYMQPNNSSPKSASFVNYAAGGMMLSMALGWLIVVVKLAVTDSKPKQEEKKEAA